MAKWQRIRLPMQRDVSWIPGLGGSLGVGIGNLLQHSCLENSRDRGAWRAVVRGGRESQTQLSTHGAESEGVESAEG